LNKYIFIFIILSFIPILGVAVGPTVVVISRVVVASGVVVACTVVSTVVVVGPGVKVISSIIIIIEKMFSVNMQNTMFCTNGMHYNETNYWPLANMTA